jgi:hypothetical protein
MDIQTTGLKAVQAGSELAARSATEVVQASFSSGDMVTPIVHLHDAARQVEAGAAVIKVGNAMDRAVLDLFV